MRRAATVVGLVAGMTASLATAHAQSAFKVGVTHRTFLKDDASYDWRGAKTHALTTTIWYPADAQAQETAQWVGDPENAFATAGCAAQDAPMAKTPAKFPLVLLSHGTGGSAPMMAWLGTRLAGDGYIAVAVNHPGNNAVDAYTVEGFTLGWERAVDLSRVLDGMLGDEQFASRIDPERIGAAGFSLGGYTMMVIAGAVARPFDLEALAKACNAPRPTNPLCASPPEFPGLTEKALALAQRDPAYRAAIEKSAESHRDPRVRAVFAIAPVDLQLTKVSLEGIRMPVKIVVGASDPIAPAPRNAEVLAGAIPGAKLTILPGGVAHYTFLDTCTALGRKQSPQFCVDKPGVDREGVHTRVARLAAGFFGRALGRE